MPTSQVRANTLAVRLRAPLGGPIAPRVDRLVRQHTLGRRAQPRLALVCPRRRDRRAYATPKKVHREPVRILSAAAPTTGFPAEPDAQRLSLGKYRFVRSPSLMTLFSAP